MSDTPKPPDGWYTWIEYVCDTRASGDQAEWCRAELLALCRKKDGYEAELFALRASSSERIKSLERVLNLAEIREANVARCEASFFKLDEWTPLEYGGAAAGELGECCNLLKKMRRGQPVSVEEIGNEIADTLTYLDLLAARLGIDLSEALVRKFNVVSDRVGSPIKLRARSALPSSAPEQGRAK